MKIYHGGPGYKEDERMHWLSKKRYKIGLVIPTLVVYMVFIIIPIGSQLDIVLQNILELERLHSTD